VGILYMPPFGGIERDNPNAFVAKIPMEQLGRKTSSFSSDSLQTDMSPSCRVDTHVDARRPVAVPRRYTIDPEDFP
jgi:hypothetical protein